MYVSLHQGGECSLDDLYAASLWVVILQMK